MKVSKKITALVLAGLVPLAAATAYASGAGQGGQVQISQAQKQQVINSLSSQGYKVIDVETDNEKGKAVFEVDAFKGKDRYELTLDANSLQIIGSELDNDPDDAVENSVYLDGAFDAKRQEAVDMLTQKGYQSVEVDADEYQGKPILEAEAMKNGTEYEIKLAYPSLDIISEEAENSRAGNTASANQTASTMANG